MTRPTPERPCPNIERIASFAHGPAQDEHSCPYKAEINDDGESLCECCEACTHECAMDV